MRGHEALIAMRLAGKKPRSVSIMLFPAQEWVARWNEHPATVGDATVVLDEKDQAMPARLDLRFLVGLGPVIVNGPDADITTKVGDACMGAGASHVVVAYYGENPEHLIRLTEHFPEVAHG
jgi:hypothetical protein